jgi:hypothetical protein
MRRGTWIAQFGIVGRADAADEDFHIAFLVGNAQPRNRLLQLAQFNDAVLAQLVRTQRLDDAGHVLEILFATVGRDDDVTRSVLGRRARSRLCRRLPCRRFLRHGRRRSTSRKQRQHDAALPDSPAHIFLS